MGQTGGADASKNKGNTGQLEQASTSQPASERRKRKFKYRKVADLESDIAELESHIAGLHTQMLEPANLRDGRKMKELQNSLAECEAKLMLVYEHYEEACELN